MKEKLFVISIDSMIHEDVAYMETKPNFSKIMKKRAEVERVCSVYPSVTYPAHVSIMTGCRPGKHGIYENSPLHPGKQKYTHWYLHHKNVRVEDIFAAAKRAGRTTAAVYWPVTACNPNIDHVINEYFFYYPGEEQDIEGVFARQGADETALRAVRENLNRFPTTREPECAITSTFDEFVVGCTCSLIRSVQPDVMLVHVCDVDTFRHLKGTFSGEVKESLDRMDRRLGEILQAMEEAGVYEDTNFVIVSDHGQMPFERNIAVNALLVRGGFIDIAPDGGIYSWQAYAKSNRFSSNVYLRDKDDAALRQKVYDYLKGLAEENCWGFEAVYTAEETRERYGTYGAFSFMLESDGRSCLHEPWDEPVIRPLTENCSTHGHQPEKGPQPVFLGSGPAFRDGVRLARAQLVDIAPTLAGIMGQTMPEAEGHCLEEMLR